MDTLLTLTGIMLAANLRTIVVTLGVAIAISLFGRLVTAQWRSLLWLLVFVPLAIPFAPPSPLSLYNLLAAPETARRAPNQLSQTHNIAGGTTVSSGDFQTPTPPNIVTNSFQDPAADNSPFPLRNALTFAWMIGAVIFASRLIINTWRLSRALRRLPVVSSAPIQEALISCTREVGLRRVPRAVITPGRSGPAIAGLLRPVLMLRAGLADSISPRQLRLVLLHELRHAHSGDLIVNWLLNLLTAVHWWNPIVWGAHRQWLNERELACDAWVASHAGGTDHKPYAETILKITELADGRPVLPLTAGITSRPSLTERRILAMKTPRKATWVGFLIGCSLVGSIAAVGLTDRARGQDGSTTDAGADENPSESASRDEPATGDDSKVPPATSTRSEPIIVFTKHLILWGNQANEAVTWEEMAKRLTQLAEKGPVHPQFKFTNGADFNKGQDHIFAAQRSAVLPKFDGMSLGSVAPAAGERLDPIETPEGLKPNPADRLAGNVLLPDGRTPAAGAQVVVIAPEVEHRAPLPITLVNGQLRGPVDEQWAPADANGDFTVYPQSDDRAMTILHPDGFLYLPAPIDRTTKTYRLIPWAIIELDASQLMEDESLSLTIYPEGAEGSSRFSVYLSEHRQNGRSPTRIKIPPGRVTASRGLRLEQGTIISTPVHELSLKPGETGSYRVPPLSAKEREQLRETSNKMNKHREEAIRLQDAIDRREHDDRIKKAQDMLSR